jgi:hypothetical protein
MLPAVRPGDILIARPPEGAPVGVGDIVLFRCQRGLCAHRVIGVGANGVRTRGDAVRRDDGLLSPADLVGVVERIHRGGLELVPSRALRRGQRAVAALLRRSSLLRGLAGKLARVSASESHT